MRRVHLGVQAAIVLAMVSSVSWPQFRQFRAAGTTQSVWRYVPDAVLLAKTNDAARFAGDARLAGGRPGARVSNAAYTTGVDATTRNPIVNAPSDPSYATPAAVAVLGGRVNALLGFARTSLNTPIAYARVVLRNLRTGRVSARAVANERGEFSFVDLESNAYVVELLGPDGSVVAASPLVSMARGDVQQTELRVAAAATTITASFGTMAPTLQQATAVAAGSDVARTTAAQTPQESPR
jgi:hypothetical protein